MIFGNRLLDIKKRPLVYCFLFLLIIEVIIFFIIFSSMGWSISNGDCLGIIAFCITSMIFVFSLFMNAGHQYYLDEKFGFFQSKIDEMTNKFDDLERQNAMILNWIKSNPDIDKKLSENSEICQKILLKLDEPKKEVQGMKNEY